MPTPTFSLAPSPKWYFADAQGRPAAGGTMTTYSATDHSTPKFIYSDPTGLDPYANPMVLDASGGTKCPMYWDVTTPGLYYVVVADAAGNIICTVDKFPLIGGGGVTPITTAVDIENHLINGQFLFIDAIDETLSLVSPIPEGETHMAPGSGFFKDVNGNYVPSIDPLITAGWSFKKASGGGATDNIQFVAVTALGAGVPTAPTANATRFFQFTTSAIGAGYTEAFWRNVIPNVELFEGEIITVSFDTHGTVGAPAEFDIVQHFGTGGAPSADVVTPVVFNYSGGAWARQSFTLTVPSIVGKSKGTNQDDCLILQWGMPLNVLGTFQLDNHQLQRGTFGLQPYIEQTYAQDQYKVLIDLLYNGNIIFKTGELKFVSGQDINNPGQPVPIAGWIPLVDYTQEYIGSASSSARFADNNTQNLYILWWNSFDNTVCPVSGGRGADALSDFNANKTMKIPDSIIGTALVAAGNGPHGNFPFGHAAGELMTGLTVGQLPSHHHTTGVGGSALGAGGGISFALAGSDNSGDTGSNEEHNNQQPTLYLYLYVKL